MRCNAQADRRNHSPFSSVLIEELLPLELFLESALSIASSAIFQIQGPPENMLRVIQILGIQS
jgi:hypothetical protein